MDRVLAALTLPLLPAWLLVTALHPRLRVDLRERWGLSAPLAQPGSIWIHGASVGEIRAAARLLPHLPRPILLTADTDTGAQEARRIAGGRIGVTAQIRPVDHGLVLAALWAEARPRIVIFIEGTFWPSLAWRARRAGVAVVRLGTRASARTRRAGPLLRWWWWPTDVVLARDEASAQWLRSVQGAPVEVAGDLKALAIPIEPSPLRFEGPFVVGASTRDGDEARLLDATEGLGLQVLLAPRHLDRIGAIEAACRARGRIQVRRSELPDGAVPAGIDVVILDTLGELHRCLAGARLVLIGGTFDPAIGGHTPWEAAMAGSPVVAGPHGHAQGGAFEAVGAVRVHGGAGPGGLADVVQRMHRAPVVPAPARGEGSRLVEALEAHLGPPAPEVAPRPWAIPLALALGLGLSARDVAHGLGLQRSCLLPVPVISVGSTNARSPGRTSTVRALVAVLAQRGHRVGVALRGYRRQRPGRDVRLSTETSLAADLGDEGALLAAAGALVAAGPDRVACGRALVAAGVSVVVLDDGLGQRRLHRDLDLAVIDARFPAARGLLPAGERRELAAVPAWVDLVLVHHGGGLFQAEGLPVIRSPGPWQQASGPSDPPDGPVLAFCGIGRPADFLASLDRPVAAFVALADHQPLTAAFAESLRARAGGLPLVCTAKDAVRLPSSLRGVTWWRDVSVSLPSALLSRLPPYQDS